MAAKENCDLPVIVTLTFDEDGKLLTGADVLSAVAMVEGLGADAVGFNCGLGPKQMRRLLPQLIEACSLPIVLNPNAGLPVQRDGKTVFDVAADEFAALMQEMIPLGISVAGGCCGTTPEHIKALIEKCYGMKPGGHVAAFAASRTYHRLAGAIEDAGFIVFKNLIFINLTKPLFQGVNHGFSRVRGKEAGF